MRVCQRSGLLGPWGISRGGDAAEFYETVRSRASSDDITAGDKKEHEGLADFVVFTKRPEAMTDASEN